MSGTLANVDDPSAIELNVTTDHDVKLPAQEIVTGRGLVAGVSGAGKSNTATVVAEEVLELGIPIVALDPEGEFIALKDEYPVVVFGSDPDADVTGSETEAGKLAQRAVRESVPVVFDLSGFPEGEAEAIASSIASNLFRAEKRHEVPLLFIADEIDQFLPEMGKTAASKPLKRLAQRGRKRGCGILAVSQRPANVSKNIVSQADYHVWHRLKWGNDQDVAEEHVRGSPVDDFAELDDGEVVLGLDWLDAPARASIRLKRVTDLGATPSIERSLGSVPSEIPDELLEGDDSSHETDCSDCPFCRTGVEPPAHVGDAVTASDGDVLGVYLVQGKADNSIRVFIREKFLGELGLETGDTVSVGIDGGDVRLYLDDSGFVSHTIGEGCRVSFNGRALDLVGVEAGDHVQVLDRDGEVYLERVTGRPDALEYPLLARKQPYTGKTADERANSVGLPKAVIEYLDVSETVGVDHRDDDVYLTEARPDSDVTYTTNGNDAGLNLGAKALRPMSVRSGDTVLAKPLENGEIVLDVARSEGGE